MDAGWDAQGSHRYRYTDYRLHRESHSYWDARCCLEYTFYGASLLADILVSTASEGEIFSAGEALRHLNQRPRTFLQYQSLSSQSNIGASCGRFGNPGSDDFIFLR